MTEIVVPDAKASIAFYVAAFGAVEDFRLVEPSGKVGHAQLSLGGTRLMLSDPYPEHGVAPPPDGVRSMRLHLYVEDVDAVVTRALAMGAVLTQPVKDQFYGDRSGTITDIAGHAWNIASRREVVSPAEMQRRWDAMMQTPEPAA
ncbi:VOC family protein [Plastoroseomonas arctica]|uniref:VOC family protein n=1 Tax=Plastoroseomonas arctica TaxID=1509237 RepID=A0AAF1JW99_9PROT|nr:VOC family protein [Plastoroseomonas arctica]MBR0654587.1 VOC family protein [Plastoroseomonas arctica]